MATPARPINRPVSVMPLIFVLKKIISINATHKGYNAPISAPSPLLIYFTLHVLRPLASINMRAAIIVSQPNCLSVGSDFFFIRKYTVSMVPAINWRIYETDNAGTSRTPILLATHVVPHIIQVSARAKYAWPFFFFRIFSSVTINYMNALFYVLKRDTDHANQQDKHC